MSTIAYTSSYTVHGGSSPVTTFLSAHSRVEYDDREDLTSEGGYSDEDMGDLSDSPSSRTSYSRPSTPHGQTCNTSSAPNIRTRKSSSPCASDMPYSMAPKAERILGLSPGTLPHAKAALESAKEEVRRLDQPIAPLIPLHDHFELESQSQPQPQTQGGMKKRLDRAVKAMSIALPHNTKIPGVIVGTGGKEDELKRERMRRANDGVLYWQKEVARLTAESQEVIKTRKKR